MKKKAKRSSKKTRRARRKNPGLLLLRNPGKKTPKRRSAKRAKPVRAKRKTRRNPVWDRLRSIIRSGRAIDPKDLRELAAQDPEFKKALARHRRFHGSDPATIEIVEVPGVKDLGFKYASALGAARAHEYQVHAQSGRAGGPPYRHAFDKNKNVTITSPDGKALLVAKRRGSKLRVTDRGIIG